MRAAAIATLVLLVTTGCFIDMTVAMNKGNAGAQPPPPAVKPCDPPPHHEGEYK